MTHLTPRRRDVRERLLALHEILDAMTTEIDTDNSTAIYGDIVTYPALDYDRDFLTNVRDALRAGDDLEDAVLGAVTEEAEAFTEVGEIPEDFLRRIGPRGEYDNDIH